LDTRSNGRKRNLFKTIEKRKKELKKSWRNMNCAEKYFLYDELVIK